MKTIEIKDNQTLLDIALQYYGTAEAIGEILANNPGVKNDSQALVDAGRTLGSLHPDVKLATGTLSIDDNSRMVKKTVVKKIDSNVTTYMTAQWQERLNK